MPRLVQVDDVTRDILREWVGPEGLLPPDDVGATWMPGDELAVPYGSATDYMLDDQGAVIPRQAPAARSRVVLPSRFFDLFTQPEMVAIFALIDSGDLVARYLDARIRIGDSVDLLHPRVSEGLAYLNAQGVFGRDPAVADAEVARIVANQDPVAGDAVGA